MDNSTIIVEARRVARDAAWVRAFAARHGIEYQPGDELKRSPAPTPKQAARMRALLRQARAYAARSASRDPRRRMIAVRANARAVARLARPERAPRPTARARPSRSARPRAQARARDGGDGDGAPADPPAATDALIAQAPVAANSRLDRIAELLLAALEVRS